jgi:uncharacterized protein (DUF2342 family)
VPKSKFLGGVGGTAAGIMSLTERSIFSVSSAELRNIFEGFAAVLVSESVAEPPELPVPALSARAAFWDAIRQAPRMQQIFRTLLGLTMPTRRVLEDKKFILSSYRKVSTQTCLAGMLKARATPNGLIVLFR